MPTSSPQRDSSVKFEHSKSMSAPRRSSARPHTPRLQHSPSLPNIWFPPHSRPTPIDTSTTEKNQTQQNHVRIPSSFVHHSPTATMPSPLPKSQGDELQFVMQKLSLKDGNAVKPTNTNSHKRRRKDRDASYHLLTPPLTPSSSIRTNTSVDFVDGKQDEKTGTLQELRDPEATRFLYLENISRTAPILPLQTALTDALAHISFRRTSVPPPPHAATDDNTSCIKGFFLRHVKSTGTLFLAFHDVRDSIAAKTVLENKNTGSLAKYLSEEVAVDNSQFNCRFVTAEELVKAVGTSNFLATAEGGFSLSVTVINAVENNEPETLGQPGQCVNVQLLAELLESYGDLRLLKLESGDDESGTFIIEFFDVRDASEAYASLNDRIVSGMKLRTSGRVAPKLQDNDGVTFVLSNKSNQNRSDTPQSNHQPSASESHIIQKLKPTIGRAGEASQMRGRFVGQAPQPRPRAVSVGERTTSSSSPTRSCEQQPKAPSPTVFYTSFDLPDPYPLEPFTPHEGCTTKYSGYNEVQTCDHPNEVTKIWEPLQTCTIADCRYCPSKGQESPAAQFPPHHHMPPNSVPFPTTHPIQGPFMVPEIEAQGYFPAVGWPTDYNAQVQAVVTSVEMFSPTFVPAIPIVPADHHLPNHNPDPSFVHNHLVFPSISPALHIHPHAFVDQHSAAAPHHHSFSNNSANGSSPDLDPFKLSPTSPGVNDRNFLNIARIEDGLDTRTTVMIKNIPNKMSAKDLEHYITEVCPRRIDFLYLRMDFKNGCNVGYAFVNFIRVQDMLKFAKKRLGVKWNMFSSEKVLQMSYANYQGKEALVEKFRNSCIMDERDEWRPKIFYSNGPEQGLSEPFPRPTHMRRKERSSHNRGALFVPCMMNGSASGNGHPSNGPSRRQEYLSNPKYLEHRNSTDAERNGRNNHNGPRRRKAPYERF